MSEIVTGMQRLQNKYIITVLLSFLQEALQYLKNPIASKLINTQRDDSCQVSLYLFLDGGIIIIVSAFTSYSS